MPMDQRWTVHPQPITSLTEYVSLVAGGEPSVARMFRGEPRRFDTALTPKAHRPEFRKYDGIGPPIPLQMSEPLSLASFKLQAAPHLEIEPANDWEWLMIAQHHGMATRLLDWTRNPLAALYFAVEESNGGEESVVWALRHSGEEAWTLAASVERGSEERRIEDPFAITSLTGFTPRHVAKRVIAQSALFTAHPPEFSMRSNYTQGTVLEIPIAGKSRSDLRWQLERLNMTRATLFPDLDGIATMVNRFRSHFAP